jgi:hypothetical protein
MWKWDSYITQLCRNPTSMVRLARDHGFDMASSRVLGGLRPSNTLLFLFVSGIFQVIRSTFSA